MGPSYISMFNFAQSHIACPTRASDGTWFCTRSCRLPFIIVLHLTTTLVRFCTKSRRLPYRSKRRFGWSKRRFGWSKRRFYRNKRYNTAVWPLDLAWEALKTLSKILIALCLLANAQALIAQEANTRDSMRSDTSKVCGLQNQIDQGDPMYRYQWHLSGKAFSLPDSRAEPFNTNPSTQTVHLNVEAVWEEDYKGQGIYIAIVDAPIDIEHPDLKENIAIEYNHNYSDRPVGSHGTEVAGVAAARGYNGIGVRGVAPLAYMFGLSGQSEDTHILNSFIRHRRITAVSNHSYGDSPFYSMSMAEHLAMETGINEGFYGKGTVYVLAAGNNANSGDNANYESLKNYHAGITVCGVDYQGKYDGFSDPGANLWVCALNAADDFKYGIVTTDLCNAPVNYSSYNRYQIHATGTSFSTPMVAGIVALMRQANPNLSWRDVKVILADSARKNDDGNEGWGESGMKYGSFGERYHFNHLYGFGLVDAKAAVDLAEEWVNLPPREEDTIVEKEFNPMSQKEIRKSLSVESDINFIEHVDATIDFNIRYYHDLSIELISPSGTTSTLAAAFNKKTYGYNGEWRFGSSRHLGEQASGEWHLIARNARAGNTITLRSWELRIRGYQVKLEAVAAADLSDLNQASPPLTLSLHGALWKETLEPSDFILQDAPKNLSIVSVERTSSTQAQLNLKSTGKLNDDYDFQVVATTGTVSNRATSLRSNNIIAPPKLEVVAAEDLSDSNQTSSLTLSLLRAHWKDTLKRSNFRLLPDPTQRLGIADVERTSSTQIQLDLKESKPSAYYSFQVEAAAGTISDHSTPLISNAIEIARIAHNKEAVISQVTKGFYYQFTAGNILISPTTLTYAIKVVKIVNGVETEMNLETLGFTQNGPIISGTPTDPGAYYFRITATREPGISRTEDIAFDIQPPHTVQTQIKVYPEGLLE